MDKQALQFNPVLIWLRFNVRMIFFTLILMWPAGIWNWWEAWVMVGLWFVFGVAIFFIAGIALYIVPGFDVVRYGWSEPLPLWMKIVAIIAHIPCFFCLGWVIRENTFLAKVVKIDEQRGHQVITTGPYAYVRHPMYTFAIILFFAIPVTLGSRYTLLLAAFLTLLLLVRTYLEDRTLHDELEGYVEYAKHTPYRVISGIW